MMAAKDFERTPRKKRNFKRSNNDLRARAKNLVRIWFEDRVDNQTNLHAAVNGKPVLPAREYNSTPERADPVPKTKRRQMLDAEGKPMFDQKGDPIFETVSILDTLTADGRETNPVPRGENKHRGDYSGYYGPLRDYDDDRLQLGRRASIIMAQVHNIAYEYFNALEMSAAGYETQYIAAELGCGENMARSLVDEGIAVVCVLILDRRWS